VKSGGFMVQVQERSGLGLGQKIETDMARIAKLKVFRIFQHPHIDSQHWLEDHLIAALAREVQSWLNSGADDLETVQLASNGWEGVYIVKGGQVLRRYDAFGKDMIDEPFKGMETAKELQALGEMGVTL